MVTGKSIQYAGYNWMLSGEITCLLERPKSLGQSYLLLTRPEVLSLHYNEFSPLSFNKSQYYNKSVYMNYGQKHHFSDLLIFYGKIDTQKGVVYGCIFSN